MGLLVRIHRINDHTKPRVVDGMPNLRDREDFPLMSHPQSSMSPQRVFSWADAGTKFDEFSNNHLRELAWSDVEALKASKEKQSADVLSMVTRNS
jgi:hypothetical protein